jgi:predicted unusual protein kinase regulating ubiquinone biosynthesis (AarF/ABC1/UbiB family)
MGISLRPSHLARYAAIARLLWKHTRPEIRRTVTPSFPAPDGEPPPAPAESSDLANDLEALGPTFVKLGQLLSTRPDLLAPAQIESLARLQDRCEPVAFDEIRDIVERDLGARISKIFADFEPAPVAAASLGQVHRATLRDGRRVAVKVQRPGVVERVDEDIQVLASAAEFLDRHTNLSEAYRFADLIEEFRRSLARELDYQAEARHLQRLDEVLEPYPRLMVPRPVPGLSAERVLTMEYVKGRKITDINPLGLIDIDGRGLADELFAGYLEQILVAGFFHADPHPGNVFITEDGRLALLDVGMVGTLGPEMQESLLRLLLAASEGRGEEAAGLIERMGEPLAEFDRLALRRGVGPLVSENRDSTVAEIAVGRLVIEMSVAASNAGLRLPAELTLLGKALLHLDEIARTLAPDFEPNEAIRRHAAELSGKRLRAGASLRRILATSHDLAEFVERLPARANLILDRVANNELSVRVDALDHRMLLQGAQTIANRIVLGLVLAALIVGAALLMQVETTFRIFGYPGLAMLCFLGAAAGGVALVLTIVLGDVRSRVRGPRSRD